MTNNQVQCPIGPYWSCKTLESKALLVTLAFCPKWITWLETKSIVRQSQWPERKFQDDSWLSLRTFLTASYQPDPVNFRARSVAKLVNWVNNKHKTHKVDSGTTHLTSCGTDQNGILRSWQIRRRCWMIMVYNGPFPSMASCGCIRVEQSSPILADTGEAQEIGEFNEGDYLWL